MFFTDGYSSSLSASTIAGNRTSFTTISVCSATAQWYVTRYAGSHHNHQGCITISNLFPFLLLTLRHRWSVYVATPFHPHLTYSIHRNSLDNHGTSQPLRWCRQSEPFIFIEPGSANNNFLRLAAFAQRTRKARLLLTCGAIHLVPPPSHPSRGAWIEIVRNTTSPSIPGISRTPHGVRGLKSAAGPRPHGVCLSHPSRVRGLNCLTGAPGQFAGDAA